jgi:predicted HicB family RNase H-like nuclease
MNNVLEYKGYYGFIKYNDEDECFYGKVEGLRKSLILFEGKSVKELKQDFERAIDEHLEMCKKLNINPERQFKGSLNVRLGTALHQKAKIKSLEKNISINELIKEAVEAYVNK